MSIKNVQALQIKQNINRINIYKHKCKQLFIIKLQLKLPNHVKYFKNKKKRWFFFLVGLYIFFFTNGLLKYLRSCIELKNYVFCNTTPYNSVFAAGHTTFIWNECLIYFLVVAIIKIFFYLFIFWFVHITNYHHIWILLEPR